MILFRKIRQPTPIVLRKYINNNPVHHYYYNNINGLYISYIDSDDPVIKSLKHNILFGFENARSAVYFTTKNTDGVIIDCGCHIGTFAIPLALTNRKVICIDGSNQNLVCLKDTLKQEQLNNIRIIPAILDKKIRRCGFPERLGPFGSINLKGRKRKSITLDMLLKNEKNIALIKLDLEGTETSVLQGSKKIIKKHRPVLLIEINQHCQNLHNSSVKDLFNEIISNDYYILIKEKSGDPDCKCGWCDFNHWSRVKIENHIDFPPMMVKDVICIPYEKILNYDCECGRCFNFHYIKKKK